MMSTLQTAIKQTSQSRLGDAIRRGQEYLFSQQNLEGFWWAELEANVTLTAEYIMLHRILIHADPANARSNGKDRRAQTEQMARYLLREQRAHGGWELFYGDGGEISTTIEAYFALKLAGHAPDELPMQRAREFILERGGLARARVFTKLHLALFGAYPWQGIPTLPPWFMCLPSWFPLNTYTMASWARSSTVPLLVVIDKKPVYDLGVLADELFVEGSRDRADVGLKNNDGTAIGAFFLAADKVLKTLDRAGLVPLREQGIAAAERWVIERQDTTGDWAGIVPAMLNSILMFHALGYSARHPYIKRGLDALDRFCIEEGTIVNSELPQYLRLQPCISPTWDTALGLTALLDSGASPTDVRVKAAGDWLLTKQIFRYGDWAVFNRKGRPAGWAFEFFNDYYPDVDDTAAVIMSLLALRLDGKPDDDEYKLEACRAATAWVMTMQCKAGGWAAFDIDNTQDLWNQMPYGDLKAMIDPPTADLTGRVLELLGHWQAKLGEKHYRDEDVRRAIGFLLGLQEKDGSWWGRWGVNYIYGTYLALVGLRSIAPFIGFDMDGDEVKQAAGWLRSVQNADGGWGETCESYKKPELRGRGPSAPSQTAWALMGLMAAGDYETDSVHQGVEYLLQRQNADGSWPEPEFTGTGFPGHFYINYHQYRNQFPLTALGRYQQWLDESRKR